MRQGTTTWPGLSLAAALGIGLGSTSRVASAAFVHAFGNVSASAGQQIIQHPEYFQSASGQYDTGELVRASTSGSNSTGADGMLDAPLTNDGFGHISYQTTAQHVAATATSKAYIGKLQAKAFANGQSGLENLPNPEIRNYDTIDGRAGANALFQDAVTFTSDDLIGSDFRIGIGLHDNFEGFGNFIFSGGTPALTGDATVFLYLSRPDTPSVPTTTLLAYDQYRVVSSGTTRTRSPLSQFTMLHVAFGQTIKIQFDGQLSVGATQKNVTGAVTMDASSTADFVIATDDPLGHYTAESGTIYATELPEPTAVVVAAGAVAGGLLRRRRRAM